MTGEQTEHIHIPARGRLAMPATGRSATGLRLREKGRRMGRTGETHPAPEAARRPRTAVAMGNPDTPPVIHRETSKPARRGPGALLAPAALLLAGTLAATTVGAGVYRVTCKGIHKLSSEATDDSCAESGMLDDAQGRFLPSFSEALADLGRGVLAAAAGGGAIRNVGYDGREATSVIIERFRLDGSWTGTMPVEITMKLRYRFGGDGESRLGALLRSSASREIRGEHRAEVWMRYTELGGAVVLAGDTKGRFEQPRDGSIANGTTIELKVIQGIDAAAPEVEIRADLVAYAMPNLGSFEESLTSLVNAHGEIEFAAPCAFRIEAPSHMTAWNARVASRDPGDSQFRC